MSDDEHERARVAFRDLGRELVRIGRRLRSLSRKDFEAGNLGALRRDADGIRAVFDQIAAALDEPSTN